MANLIRISEYNVYFALSEFELLAQLTECILIIFRPSTTCTVPLTTQVLRTPQNGVQRTCSKNGSQYTKIVYCVPSSTATSPR